MAEEKKEGRKLELEDDIDFQKKEWRVERIGWGLMLALVLVAIAGLTGQGPLAHRTMGEAGGGLRVEYDGIGRYQSPTLLKAYVAPTAGDSGKVTLRLGREFVENIEIHRIDPEPRRVEAAADHMSFEFDRAPAEGMMIQFHYDPASMGTLPLRIAADNGPMYEASLFLLP